MKTSSKGLLRSLPAVAILLSGILPFSCNKITVDNSEYTAYDTDGTTFIPSFRDKSGNGYTYRPYTIITNGTEEFTVYGDSSYVTAAMLKN